MYRVAAGESCALTTACLLGHEEYQAEGIAETWTRAAAIPRTVFDDLIVSSSTFRRFVFAVFSSRVTDLFRIIEEVAFARIDVRLAQRLLPISMSTSRLVPWPRSMVAARFTSRGYSPDRSA
jgi:CRP/FNR family transcriptional regulator, anaerobic regulatory protein